MGIMKTLDILVKEGDRTPADFMARGYDAETADAFAEIVAEAGEPVPDGARSATTA